MITNHAKSAIAHLHTVALRKGFTEEQYWEHVVPKLDSLVKMTIYRAAAIQDVGIEFEADVPALMEIIQEQKPLDDRTLVEAINAINARIQEEGNRLGFVRGLQDARDTLSRMRATE